jgi:hypothetical protein
VLRDDHQIAPGTVAVISGGNVAPADYAKYISD